MKNTCTTVYRFLAYYYYATQKNACLSCFCIVFGYALVCVYTSNNSSLRSSLMRCNLLHNTCNSMIPFKYRYTVHNLCVYLCIRISIVFESLANFNITGTFYFVEYLESFILKKKRTAAYFRSSCSCSSIR